MRADVLSLLGFLLCSMDDRVIGLKSPSVIDWAGKISAQASSGIVQARACLKDLPQCSRVIWTSSMPGKHPEGLFFRLLS